MKNLISLEIVIAESKTRDETVWVNPRKLPKCLRLP